LWSCDLFQISILARSVWKWLKQYYTWQHTVQTFNDRDLTLYNVHRHSFGSWYLKYWIRSDLFKPCRLKSIDIQNTLNCLHWYLILPPLIARVYIIYMNYVHVPHHLMKIHQHSCFLLLISLCVYIVRG
jgi:hypothetical protein